MWPKFIGSQFENPPLLHVPSLSYATSSPLLRLAYEPILDPVFA